MAVSEKEDGATGERTLTRMTGAMGMTEATGETRTGVTRTGVTRGTESVWSMEEKKARENVWFVWCKPSFTRKNV